MIRTVRIVYCGCGRFGIESIEQLVKSNHELVHIITHPAKPAGRGRKSRPNDVAVWAVDNNVDFTEIADSNSPEGIELLKSLSPDLVVVIAFGQKISQEFISIPKNGAINVHASLLPKYRGAAPINWAIINGEKKTGVSIITLAETMDAGEILASAEIDILPEDTTGTLHDRLAAISGGPLLETIDKIAAGTAEYVKQDCSQVTLAPKLKKSDGIIDWQRSAAEIHNKIRGLWPWPAAQSDFVSAKTGEPCRVIIVSAEVVAGGGSGQAGAIDENYNVICGDGAIKIMQIKPQGGKIMDFKSFLNGRGTGSGDRFKAIEEKQL